jgi:hypothetical protein
MGAATDSFLPYSNVLGTLGVSVPLSFNEITGNGVR